MGTESKTTSSRRGNKTKSKKGSSSSKFGSGFLSPRRSRQKSTSNKKESPIDIEKRLKEFPNVHELSVFVGTWNVGAVDPNTVGNISEWMKSRVLSDYYGGKSKRKESNVSNESHSTVVSDSSEENFAKSSRSDSLKHRLIQTIRQSKINESLKSSDSIIPEENKLPTDLPQDEIDLFIFGLQEIVELKAGSIVSDKRANTEKSARTQWEKILLSNLNKNITDPTSRYMLLESKQLLGIMQLVFVKIEIMSLVSDVQLNSLGVGLMNKIGNKGATAIRFKVGDTSIVSVSAHLAARKSNVEKRNDNFDLIQRNLCFDDSSADNEDDKQLNIYDHDIVLWCGDLNYRIDIDTNKALVAIDRNELNVLKEHDQLICQRNEDKVFNGWYEGDINFKPTYATHPTRFEYDPGTKDRTPAWCDRVLWWYPKTINTGIPVKQLSYNSHEILGSDHRPVSSIFVISVYCKEGQIRDVVNNDRDSGGFTENPLENLKLSTNVDGLSGFLLKIGSPNSRRRWFVVTSDFLVYYRYPGDTYPIGFIKLREARIIESKKKKFCFLIEIPGRTYELIADNGQQLYRWVTGLKSASEYKTSVQLERSFTSRSSSIRSRLRSKRLELIDPTGQKTDPAYEGWLVKRGGKVHNYKKRWFVLRDTHKVLFYFDKRDDLRNPKGVVSLEDATAQIDNENSKGDIYAFKIITPKRTYFVRTNSEEDRTKWIDCILQVSRLPAITSLVTNLQDSD